MKEYSYATDSESGTIQAADFAEACQQLRDMLPPTAVADGAWGWVEDTDGWRWRYGRCRERGVPEAFSKPTRE
jgi:hypothetical protein